MPGDVAAAGAGARVGGAGTHATCPSAAPSRCQPGAVVDLDAAPDDPVELFVNGRRFGSGRLLLIDDEWAVRVDEVLPATAARQSTRGGIN